MERILAFIVVAVMAVLAGVYDMQKNDEGSRTRPDGVYNCAEGYPEEPVLFQNTAYDVFNEVIKKVDHLTVLFNRLFGQITPPYKPTHAALNTQMWMNSADVRRFLRIGKSTFHRLKREGRLNVYLIEGYERPQLFLAEEVRALAVYRGWYRDGMDHS